MKRNEQEKKEFEELVAANMEKVIAAGKKEKYNCYGVYCIKVDNKIVYVGKSRDMLKRVAQHMAEIDTNHDKNMYNVLRELRDCGRRISFDTIFAIDGEDDDEIGKKEAYWIRYYKPCLNIQYPKLDNYHSFDYVRRAKHITVEEVKKILDNDK